MKDWWVRIKGVWTAVADWPEQHLLEAERRNATGFQWQISDQAAGNGRTIEDFKFRIEIERLRRTKGWAI